MHYNCDIHHSLSSAVIPTGSSAKRVYFIGYSEERFHSHESVFCFYIVKKIIYKLFKKKEMKKITYLIGNRRNRRQAFKNLKSKKHSINAIVLFAVPLPIHMVEGAIDLPNTIQGRLTRAQEISGACGSSSYVSVSAAKMTVVNASITAYKGAGTGTRPGLFRKMMNQLNMLLNLFQEAANDDPVNSIAILESGKFKVVEASIPQKHKFDAKDGVNPGEIILTAPGGPKERHLHEWKISYDNVKFELIRSSSSATKLVEGLTSGAVVYFTHELIVQDVPQGVSQVIKKRVK